MAGAATGAAQSRSDRLFWLFMMVSLLLHGMLLAGNPQWFRKEPLQVIELDLLPPMERQVATQPPESKEMRPLAPAPFLSMPDVKPAPRKERRPSPPKPPEPIPERKPVQRVELPEKVKKPKVKPAPPKLAPAVPETSGPSVEESVPAVPAVPAVAGRPEGTPDSKTQKGTEDAVKHFLAQVRQRIDRHKHYPYAARRQQVEGRVTVRFVIRPDGSVEGLQLVTKSGSSLLNEAALKAVMDASPFPGFPREVVAQPLAVEMGLVFELT